MSSQYRLFSATTTRAVGVGRVNRPSTMNDSSLNLRLQAGLAHQQAGQLDQAIDCYLAVLHADPAQHAAHHQIGLAYWHSGQRERGLAHLQTALNAPQVPGGYWLALIDSLIQLGRYSEAQRALVKARQRGLPASELLGRAHVTHPPQAVQDQLFGHYARQELDACRQITHPLLTHYPAFGPGWKMMAYLFQSHGEYQAAQDAGQQASYWLPDDAEVFNNLGISARSTGNIALAEQAYLRAITLKPQWVDPYYNLSSLLYENGRLREAEPVCRQALALRPEHTPALNNLANMLRERGELLQAETVCRQALALRPDYVLAHNNLGIILHGQDRCDEAEASYRLGLSYDPHDLKTLNNLGNLLKARGRLDEAADYYRAALAQAPNMAELHGNLANVQKDLGDLTRAMAGFSHAITLNPMQADTWHNLLLTLQYADQASAADCAHWHRAFGEQFEGPWRGRVAAHGNPRDPERRLRIGWVSADFCDHAVSYFTLPLFEALAARPDLNLEHYGYSQTFVHDPISAQLQACWTKWRHVLGWNDNELEACIRQDQIDILIDLSGHTANNRLTVFARKPAPVQASWLGYPDSSGLTHIDWRITDRHGDPDGVEPRYSERLWRLPQVFCCYRPMLRFPDKRQHPDYAVWPTPALEAGYITFGCCNNIAKLTPTTLKLWAKVLHALPDSRLLLELAGLEQSSLKDTLLADFAALGIPATRLSLVHRERSWQYRRYQQIDIVLDPFPANGGTSSCDLLWMGVPLVTLAGERFVSRMGATLLHAVGHPEWIAQTPEDYVAIAQNLAADIPALDAIRQRLRAETEASPLMDEAGLTEAFGQALLGMWRKWCGEE